jgi:hypothetical protein
LLLVAAAGVVLLVMVVAAAVAPELYIIIHLFRFLLDLILLPFLAAGVEVELVLVMEHKDLLLFLDQ